MLLKNDWRLAYCTNIHRGESWDEIFTALTRRTLAVRDRVCGADRAFAIGLRLGAQAVDDLAHPETLARFKEWLAENNCYVFTINGFPYGAFHGTRVKEDVYRPDWRTSERLDYTKRLFEILSAILPNGVPGSISTVPGSYKNFIATKADVDQMLSNLEELALFLEDLSARTGQDLSLGLEPEPLCYLETSQELVEFIDRLRIRSANAEIIQRRIGINYDACHLAIEYEDPFQAIDRLVENQILINKVHISSAIKTRPTPEARQRLSRFVDPVYFHQVIESTPNSKDLKRFEDLDVALADANAQEPPQDAEWRIHFHIPLYAECEPPLRSTSDHITGLLDRLMVNPELCRGFEMETYTWEALPPDLQKIDVVDQLTKEYEWTLGQLRARGLAA